MNLPTEPCIDQNRRWPASGRHVLAHYDDETIFVYQAYRPEIGRFAIRHQRFGGEFKYTRMSWIKPNFLWMMYRSDWGQADGQEVVLAIRLRRTFFDTLLSQAVPSSFEPGQDSDHDSWTAAIRRSEVRVQWDPDHLPTGGKCERRALQLGLRGGGVLSAYGTREIIEIVDMSPFVAQQRPHVANWRDGALRTPVERVYRPASDIDAVRLGLASE